MFFGCASLPPAAKIEDGLTPDEARARLADARAAFAARPGRDAVERAHAMYLEAARDETVRTEALSEATFSAAWLVEHTQDVATRVRLAEVAASTGRLCAEREPESPPCLYALAVGLGVDAREHPSRALPALGRMVEALEKVRALAPGFDESGPDRVLALLYARAPGWPVGPGDPEAAVERARAAVDRSPDFPPNALALAEALIATGSKQEARTVLDPVRQRLWAPPLSTHNDVGDWKAEESRLRALLE